MSSIHPLVITAAVPTVGTAVRPVFRVPTGWGGITVTGAYFVNGAAATFSGFLDDLGTALGTAQSATIGTLGPAAGTFVANVQKALSLVAAPFVAEGHWLGVYIDAGITVATTSIVIEYQVGKQSA